jgi:ubiquinone/menaquinone biosynthesis C-methylase UbiE
MTFFEKTIKKVIENSIISPQDRVLIVCGGDADRVALLNNNFHDVTITNVDYDRDVKNYEPYPWEKQDADNLTYSDNSFDWTFVQAGLHHCASPHKALCEMLRVSRKGIGVFEARDSFLMRLSQMLGLVPAYELEPSVLSEGMFGGYRNTPVPNFIYRWTEREVKKTVSTYIPHYEHNYYFYYGITVPTLRLTMSPSAIKRTIGYVCSIIAPVFERILPKQCNNFAFIVSKKGKLQPWLIKNGGEYVFNMRYVEGRFYPEKYK